MKKILILTSVIVVFVIVAILGLLTAYVPCLQAQEPGIDSINPDQGYNTASTDVTILGENFQPTPKVALHGGGPWTCGSYNTPDDASDVYVAGSYAYVADGDSGLQIIDISDPANPILVGTYDTSGFADDVYVVGSHAYVADRDSGLQIVKLPPPEVVAC